MDADVERAVTALGETGERPGAPARDRPVAGVDRTDEIACDECLPVRFRPHPVRPLLVRERARRPERHDEDRGRDPVQCDELVLDHTEPDRLEKRGRPTGDAVEQVDDRVAPAGACRVAGRQVDVNRLGAAAQRGARQVEMRRHPRDMDERRIPGRSEAAIDPVVVDVAVRAEEPDPDEGRQRNGDEPDASGERRSRAEHGLRCTPRSLKERLSAY